MIKIISTIYSWHLLTLVSCRFVTLISIKSAPVLSTFGDNFREENGKKIGQSDFCWKNIYHCLLLFLDHILYRRAHFVRDALRSSRAVLAIIRGIAFTTNLHVRPAETQIKLRIRAGWAMFTAHLKTLWILGYPQCALQRLWSDYADAQADLSLRWAHMQSSRKCCSRDHMFQLVQKNGWAKVYSFMPSVP